MERRLVNHPVAELAQPPAQLAQEHEPPPPRAGEAAAEQPRPIDRRDIIAANLSSSSDSVEENRNIPDERGRNRRTRRRPLADLVRENNQLYKTFM